MVGPLLLALLFGVGATGTGTRATATPISACTGAQLRWSSGLQGATGSLAGGVLIRNRGHAACALTDHPVGRFVGRSAQGERVILTRMRPLRAGHETAAIVLRPGRAAWLTLWWSNWCGPHSKPASGSGPPPDALVLTFPGGARVRVPTP